MISGTSATTPAWIIDMAGVDVKIETNKDLFLNAMEEQVLLALELVGMQAEGHAKDYITAAGRVDTGRLRSSVAHAVDSGEKAVYIGSNVEYAVYNEVGTGIHAEGGGGRKTPWMFEGRDGEMHWTAGMTPVHMFKNAAANHTDEYTAIIERTLKGGGA